MTSKGPHRSAVIDTEKNHTINDAVERCRAASAPATLVDYHDIGTLLNGESGSRRDYGSYLIDKVASKVKNDAKPLKRSSLYKAARFAQCCTSEQAKQLGENQVSWRTIINLCDTRVDDERQRLIKMLTSGQAIRARARLTELVKQNKKVDRKTLQAAQSQATRGIRMLKKLANSKKHIELAEEAGKILSELKQSIP